MTHALKCWPEYYKQIIDGTKHFELRRDDRNFEPFDRLLLQEWDPATGKYTGAETKRTICSVHRDLEEHGLKKGYCIIQFDINY